MGDKFGNYFFVYLQWTIKRRLVMGTIFCVMGSTFFGDKDYFLGNGNNFSLAMETTFFRLPAVNNQGPFVMQLLAFFINIVQIT